MGTWRHKLLFLVVFLFNAYCSNGCQMEGVDNWALAVGTEIFDIHSGYIINRTTSNIESITSYSFNNLNKGPYLNVRLTDSQFIIETNDNFSQYEEHETQEQISITTYFRCSAGTTAILVFVIGIQDTNNNPPQFQEPNKISYTINTPVPPGAIVTGCFDGIIVRDIDLTTQRIDFAIDENPYFEIAYDQNASTTAKEFIAIIRTTTFIRSLPEPITLTITATDVDLTNDPPRTKAATVTIIGDRKFELPEEPVFSQAFYIANYTTDDQIDLPVPISLQKGFDGLVRFSLEGELRNHFELVENGNEITLKVVNPLPEHVRRENQILLVVRARRENTSGDSATIVVYLPDELPVAFDQPYSTGIIEDNILKSPALILTGYEDKRLNFFIRGDYAPFFTVQQTGFNVHLTMTSLPESVISQNNLILLEIIASTEYRNASTIVALEVLKDDTDTPVFNKPVYSGSYNIEAGLTLEEIVINQGFDSSVKLSLEGDHSAFFDVRSEGSTVTLITTSSIPPAIFYQQRILLTLLATKPRTVGANAAVIVTLPAARQLDFEKHAYKGTLQNNILTLEHIILNTGYDDTVNFTVVGELQDYFTVVNNQNNVTINLERPMPNDIIQTNNVITLTLQAFGPNAISTTTTILVDIIKEDTTTPVFSRNIYYGTYQGTSAFNIENITLEQGFGSEVTFDLQGEYAQYFQIISSENNFVVVSLRSAIPEEIIFNEKLLLFNIVAEKPLTVGANAAISIRFPKELTEPVIMRFSKNTYEATIQNNTLRAENVVLSSGYATGTEFVLTGDYSKYFALTDVNNGVSLSLVNPLPINEMKSTFIVLEVEARRERAVSVWTSIVLDIGKQEVQQPIFTKPYYQGVYNRKTNELSLEIISLELGYDDSVTFQLDGVFAPLFSINETASNSLNITATAPLPSQVLEENNYLLFSIVAKKPNAFAAQATIFINIDKDNTQLIPRLVFNATYYMGSYTNADGLLLDSPITLAEGYDQTVVFDLQGEQAQWFAVVRTDNSVTLRVSSSIPAAVLATNSHLVFIITAKRVGSQTASATIVISMTDDYIEGSILGFDRVTYRGSIQRTEVTLDPITLIVGYSQAVNFSLHGDLANHFTLTSAIPGVVRVSLPVAIPDQSIPANRLILLEIRASAPQALTGYATIVFEVIVEDGQTTPPPATPQLVFNATYYTGSYTIADGLLLHSPITLAEGYDQTVVFDLEGEHAQWFALVQTNNSITLRVKSSIPAAVSATNSHLIFVITARRVGSSTARASIVISLRDNSQTGEDDISFNKLVYEGFIQLSDIQHESIIISNYNTANVEIRGDYSSLFVARLVDGVVTVQFSGSLTLPVAVTRLALELHAANARAVLLLNVVQSDVPVLPSVTFSSSSYVLNVKIVQTGFVGRVLATSDNGEAVTYSLNVDNAHLQARVSINNEGEMYLSAPVNSGVYIFQVTATTVITRAEGTAMVYLTVEAVTVCGDDDTIVTPPLIILDRDEEEPHTNLVTLNTTQFEGCLYSLTNRWPLNQNWLYVDDNGLHARSIDREHESIAFMALSQIQVELILHCDSDKAFRTKRSQRTDWLGPYDYGLNKWILTESIPYNARRSLVNLIVNDINDNAPIFVGKDLEPIVVGYPVGEIEERILPRSLAELQATDADIGENAAIKYWSSEDVLAVAPTTGFVHVRSGAKLQDNQRLTVNATDRNGEGLTGQIQLMVKLLGIKNIAVVTVKNAFLDDEKTILTQLTNAVGYEIKALRSVVISDEFKQSENDVLRKNGETSTAGASLLIYVYGILQNEPVDVDRLTVDITNNAAVVSIISTLSLEDHLPAEINIVERDIGFMVATIVLSILLFIIIVLTAIWFFLKWRKDKNYDQFSDENSVTSRSVEDVPKPETPKPRLDIEDLRKSERRLQEMLTLSVEEPEVEPRTPKQEVSKESIIDISLPTEPNAPIVIQSIDKLKDADDSDGDEFGEKILPRRKSVVTFNENVEKIIHVEDDDDSIISESAFEVYRL